MIISQLRSKWHYLLTWIQLLTMKWKRFTATMKLIVCEKVRGQTDGKHESLNWIILLQNLIDFHNKIH